uniref:NADH-ubiquinone oxidoreductase chain 4 n=1 Tax=Melasis buprestoides TaxID=195231 RepID=A0A343C383_9COLE|nr:NADH dehydrogenase subunit 4 [Melasis buprestoides]
MLKFILFLMFMIPLCFMGDFIWLFQFFFMFIFILIFMNSWFTFYFSGLSGVLGCDSLSCWMILLSIWICMLMINASYSLFSSSYYLNMFFLMVLVLLISLFFAFSVMNLFVFYLFFEVSLIPTFMLILGWGYQPERLNAGIYMFFYTLFASLPMMISLFYLYKSLCSLDFFFINGDMNMYMFICLNLVFLIKIPMFFVHLWLPKAHVEAPVSGSMILAGVMLKLGGYGLMRVMMMFLSLGLSISFVFISVGLVGGVFVSLICLRQSDMKSLIAYSSVSHMSLALGGILSINMWGFYGAIVMMVGHGLCSSGLFCLANITYERFISRSMFLVKGLINLMPAMALYWFLLSSSNMAAPPSLNLLGEIMLINSLVGFSGIMMITLSLLSFFSACYCLYLYSFTQHGKYNNLSYSFSLGNLREYLLMILHWLPLNFLVLSANLFV